MVSKSLRFTEEDPQVLEIPKLWGLTDPEIDELFYNEDEIGEMRHTAFMIECGLEEDPPDGPDVPPIPWKIEDLKPQQQTHQQAEVKKTEEPPAETADKERERPVVVKRSKPKRTYSMDEGLEDLESDMPVKPKKREPTRRITASKSGSLDSMRRKAPPNRCMSVDVSGKNAAPLSKTFARTEKSAGSGTSPMRGRRKIAASKSGSLHEMRRAIINPEEGQEEETKRTAKRPSRLVAARSGNLHGMRKALEDKFKENDAILEEEEEKRNPSSLRSKSFSSESSGGSYDLSMESDLESDSSEDEGTEKEKKSSSKNGTKDGEKKEKKKKKKKDKDGEKKEKKKSSKDKEKTGDKSPKVKSKKSSKDKDKKEGKKESSKDPSKPASGKKFKVKKANPEDLPPAFRSMSK